MIAPPPSLAPGAALPWRPLLGADLAPAAWEAIADICQAIGEVRHAPVGSELEAPASLAFGSAGVALCLAYASEHATLDIDHEQVMRPFEEAITHYADTTSGPELFRGVAGLGWVLEHLRGWLWDASDVDDFSQIDGVLAAWTTTADAPSELMYGLAGACLYAVERAPESSGVALARQLVDALLARMNEGGWWTIPPRYERAVIVEARLQQDADLERFCLGGSLRRFGVAHGVPGTVGALAASLAVMDLDETSQARLRRTVRWSLEQRLSGPGRAGFPIFAGFPRPQHQSGWCNGDLGQALILWKAAIALADASSAQLAIEIARREAGRGVDETEDFNRHNPALCHGHAGKMHIFNRFFQATGDAAFRDAARYWARQLLREREPGTGYGGFSIPASERPTRPMRGLLMGSAGIALALLGAVSTQDPAWDRVLLLSTRATARA